MPGFDYFLFSFSFNFNLILISVFLRDDSVVQFGSQPLPAAM